MAMRVGTWLRTILKGAAAGATATKGDNCTGSESCQCDAFRPLAGTIFPMD
jgi:hypothetical protein